ncbi:7-keto-8-aminopelargonate synthetase-like enzyme [Bradyrhizobium ottawaense]
MRRVVPYIVGDNARAMKLASALQARGFDLLKMIEAKIVQKFKRQYAKLTPDEIMVLAFLGKTSA